MDGHQLSDTVCAECLGIACGRSVIDVLGGLPPVQSVRIPWRLRLGIRPQAQTQMAATVRHLQRKLDFPKAQWFEGRDHTAPRGVVLRVWEFFIDLGRWLSPFCCQSVGRPITTQKFELSAGAGALASRTGSPAI